MYHEMSMLYSDSLCLSPSPAAVTDGDGDGGGGGGNTGKLYNSTVNIVTTTTIIVTTKLVAGVFSRTSWVSRRQKGKLTTLDFTAMTAEWKWYKLDHNAGHLHLATNKQTCHKLIWHSIFLTMCSSWSWSESQSNEGIVDNWLKFQTTRVAKWWTMHSSITFTTS